MSTYVYSNNCKTTLAAAITSTSQTTITLTSTANFPTIPSGEYWAVTLNDAATRSVFEIVYVTSIAGAVLTVLRGQEGTTANTWLVGDFAYAAVTAGELGNFIQGGGNFVILSPGSPQTGFIDVTGAITGGAGTFAGVDAGGAITGATTGNFSGDVTADDFLASRAYAGTSLANLPLRVNGNTGVIGIGASSSLSAQGITATALAIGLSGSTNQVVIDTSGNLATTGNVYGTDGIFSTEVTAPEFLQNSRQVTDDITSSSLAVTAPNGHTFNIELPSTPPVGYTEISHGNGGLAAITLPSGGTWWVELIYAVTQDNNANYSMELAVTAGSVSSYGTNAAGNVSYNSVCTITNYAACSAAGGQTIEITLYVGGASLEPSPYQPWTFRATRTA